MNRLPIVVAITVGVIAAALAVIWVARYQQGTRPRPRLMSQRDMPAGTGASSGGTSSPPSGGGAAPYPGAPAPGAMPPVGFPGAAGVTGTPTMSGPGATGASGMAGGVMSMGGMLGASVPSGRQLSYSGTIQSAEKATVTSPLAGSVVEVFVKDGDTVRAGQRLLRLTPLASGRQPVVVSAPLSGLIVASLEGIESSDPALDVLVRFPHVGMRTEAGMPLFDIVNEKSAVIPLNVPERDIVYVKPGQEVTIRPRVLPRVTLRGKVVRVARAGQSRMTNGVRATVFPVTVQVLDSLDRARLGMTADVVWVEEVKDEEATQEASPPPTPTGRGG